MLYVHLCVLTGGRAGCFDPRGLHLRVSFSCTLHCTLWLGLGGSRLASGQVKSTGTLKTLKNTKERALPPVPCQKQSTVLCQLQATGYVSNYLWHIPVLLRLSHTHFGPRPRKTAIPCRALRCQWIWRTSCTLWRTWTWKTWTCCRWAVVILPPKS